MIKNEKGFGVVEVILILVIIGIIGFTGWRVYEANREASQVPIDNSTIVPREKSSVPDGWKKYENKDLSFSFAYPEEWGEVIVSNETTPHEGGHYYLDFSKYDQFKVAIKTADYIYTGLGRGVPQVNGFTNFDEEFQKIEKEFSEVIKKTLDTLVYVYAEGLNGSITAAGIARTDKQPGLEFGLITPISSFNLSDETIFELYEGNISARQYLSQEQIDTVVKFAENVKSL